MPTTIEQLTPDLLTTVLAGSGKWNSGVITRIEFTPIGGADALSSSVWRVDASTGSGPTHQLLVKLQLEGRSDNVNTNYSCEATFYERIGTRAQVQIPNTYFARWDPDADRYLLVQDFLTDGAPGTSSKQLPPEMVEKELTTLARMHAAWWNSAELADIEELRNSGINAVRVLRWLRDPELNQIGVFMSILGPELNPELGDFFETMPAWYPELDRLQSPHFTLAHSDASSKNVFYPNDISSEPVFLDWGFCRSGSPMLDFPPCCMDLSSEDMSQIPRIFQSYHSQLVLLGVDDYPIEQAWTDYQVNCMRRSYGAIINTFMGADNEAQKDRLDHARMTLPKLEQLVLSCGGHVLAETLKTEAGNGHT